MSFKNDSNANRHQAFDHDYTVWIFAAIAVLVVVALGVWVASGPSPRSTASAPAGLAGGNSGKNGSKNGSMSVKAPG